VTGEPRGRAIPGPLLAELRRVYGIDLSDVRLTRSHGNRLVAKALLAAEIARAATDGRELRPRPRDAPPRHEPIPWRGSPPVPRPIDHVETLARLVDWLRAGGAVFPSLELRTQDGHQRRAWATRPIASGELVASIPRALIMTGDDARASDVGREIDASGATLEMSQSYLAAWLIRQRRDPDSPWRPYVDALPRAFPRHPSYLREPELELLRGTLAAHRLARLRESLLRDHRALQQRVPGFERIPFVELQWARLAVVSRAFSWKVGGERLEGLVPLADMLNHGAEPEVSWGHEGDADRFAMTASRSIAPGEELRDSYGAKCNSRFYVHYGFCLEDNPADEATLTFPAPVDRFRADLAARLLWGHTLGAARSFPVVAQHADVRVKRMLGYLRLVCADDLEYDHIVRVSLPRRRLGPIGRRNERVALAMLAHAARQALAGFPTTVRDDDALLAGGGLSEQARDCVIVRRGEKRVLEQFLALAEDAGAALAEGSDPVVASQSSVAAGSQLFRDYAASWQIHPGVPLID
jgi:histone-lysine N-methyltransferase SETD3